MLNLDSISNKFRVSYFIFALLLCGVFISIFTCAEIMLEQALVKSRLLQQLQLSQQQYGQQDIYTAQPNIKIYRFAIAPANLQAMATNVVQEIPDILNNKPTELHFFVYQQDNGQKYILTYLEDSAMQLEHYPVLAIFEYFESVFDKALIAAIILSFFIALLFSYLSTKTITKPLLDLKKAVETDYQNLSELTHLPSEIEILARSIEEKNHQLQAYLKREQLFTGDVSHELRTPLTIIMGAADVLASQLEGNDKLTEFTTRISNTAQETSEIITALLLLSRSPEQLNAPKTCINTIAESEIQRLRYLIKHKPVSHHIVAKQDYMAYVRPELLKMALGNLIKNAFQYTDEGEVVVTIDAHKVVITDTGLGIPSDMMPLIYQRFERSEDNSVEGSGLGLSIVQRIMTHLDWTLTHQQNESGGSTFSIYYQK